MNRSLAVALVLVLTVIAGLVLWRLDLGIAPTDAPGAGPAAAERTAAATQTSGAADTDAATAAASAGAGAAPDRVAVASDASAAPGKLFVIGQVVGPDGRALQGAKVIAAPALAFSNANGDMDPASFDAADFTDVNMFDPKAVLAAAKEQLGERIDTLTDAEGRFRIHAPGTSRGASLRVLARGYAILDRRVERPATADVDAGVLTLQRGTVVSGRVADGAGNPIAGARVRRVPEMEARVMDQFMGGADVEMEGQADVEALRDGETAVTDRAGRFELAHVVAGELTLRARHADHPTARVSDLTAVAGAELRDVVITMQSGLEIRGRVTGIPAGVDAVHVACSKKPDADAAGAGAMGGFFGGDFTEMLADMGMPFGDRTVPVAADGTFVLKGLAAANYRVWPTQPGEGRAGNGACGPRADAAAGAFGIELRYEPGIAVTFTVVDAATKKPIEQLFVRDALRGGGGFGDMMAMMPSNARLQSYPGGAVTVANVRPKPKQTLTLTVDAIGYRTFERKDITLPASGALDLGTVELSSSPVVEVVVVADDNGAPVSGAKVRLVDGPGEGGAMMFNMSISRFGDGTGPRSGRTDARGRCTLNALPAGKGMVAVESPRFAPFTSDELTFAPDGATNYTARLRVGGRVDVTVLGPDDKPVKDAVVEHKTPGGDTSTKKSDAAGVVAFERLAPGSHGFRIDEDSGPMDRVFRVSVEGVGETPWENVEVVDRGASTLQLAKKITASLRGVVRESGAPLEDARVMFVDGEGGDSDQEAAMELMGDMMAGMGGNKRSTKSDAAGEYSLSGLPEGVHRLRVSHKERAMQTVVTVTLRNGENVFDVELETTTLRGIVKDAEGKPVDGARVRVSRVRTREGDVAEAEAALDGMLGGFGMNSGGSAKSDENGAFELRGVDPDVELSVRATAKGYAPAQAKVTVARGTTSGVVELRVGPAGRIKVSSAVDGPMTVVTARYVGAGDKAPPVTQMLRKGKGTLDGLKPGTWELEIGGMGIDGEDRKRTVEVIAGQTVDVAF